VSRLQVEHELEDKWKDEQARLDEVLVRDSDEVAAARNECEVTVDTVAAERTSSEQETDDR